MLRNFFDNHVFANLTFALILVLGFLSYFMLPRQQDPDMNFNWISIITFLPGASAEEVEKLVTDPLEEALDKLPDVNFVLSSSREATSDILVRFNDMSDRVFDKRVTDLRREVSNKERELPEAAEEPMILEITSSNGFPTVMVVVVGRADDENLRRQARLVERDLERIKGVDGVAPLGLRPPELQVRFSPAILGAAGITPMTLADTVSARFRDVAGGTLRMGGETRLLRLQGTSADPEELAQWTLVGNHGERRLGEVAQVARGRKKAAHQVRFQGRSAVLLSVTKRPSVNVLELTARIRTYLASRKKLETETGVEVILANDQTHYVRNALSVMENNALLGLLMVMLTTWIFLGSRIALLIGLGIPFTLAGTFGVLYSAGHSLNVMVLLGVVISLGMLVDDAVVVVESIYAHIQKGMGAMAAGLASLREVAAPVTTSVLTTMAAFLPLMLLPGILGKYMRVIPLVVTLALAISLIEAFWMLPAHVAALNLSFDEPSRLHRHRTAFLQRLRRTYVRLLLKVFRRPRLSLTVALLPVAMAVSVVSMQLIKVDFFAMDPFPLFYVNVKMPPGSSLQNSMETVLKVERRVRAGLRPGEVDSVVSYAGQMFTDTKPFFGDRFGQVLVNLTPDKSVRRTVAAIIDGMRGPVTAVPGAETISFLPLSGGPPVTKPVSVKVRGNRFEPLRRATDELKQFLAAMPAVSDITDDFDAGSPELVLRPDGDGIRRGGFQPGAVMRLTRLLADGEVPTHFQHQGEKVEVRILAHYDREPDGVDDFLAIPIARTDGGVMPLGELTDHETRRGVEAVRHFNFRRAITVSADIDKSRIDTVAVNEAIKAHWETIRDRYPGMDLDFSGILDDIYEAMDAIGVLFLLGVGLMYMILGTQFRSYFQPLMILMTVPMAFTGVVCGVLITGDSLSLYTLYGVVALSGIAVNASIVLISAANSRLRAGMTVQHAVIFAARRRVVPILITTVTTIAGLFSLAVGLGGHSLLWGPVATAIVWGLVFSTFLTLFLVPLLYGIFMGGKGRSVSGPVRRLPGRPAFTGQPR